MKKSKYNKNILRAFNKGYRVVNGEVIYEGNTRKLQTVKGYAYFNFRHLRKSTKCKVHRLAAFQKFGKKMFEPGIEVRHLDSNSLNNQESNIAIGTKSQNAFDKPIETRIRQATIASHSYHRQQP